MDNCQSAKGNIVLLKFFRFVFKEKKRVKLKQIKLRQKHDDSNVHFVFSEGSSMTVIRKATRNTRLEKEQHAFIIYKLSEEYLYTDDDVI